MWRLLCLCLCLSVRNFFSAVLAINEFDMELGGQITPLEAIPIPTSFKVVSGFISKHASVWLLRRTCNYEKCLQVSRKTL
jgi:hypothetical protein